MAMSHQRSTEQQPNQTQEQPQATTTSVDGLGNAHRTDEAGLGGRGAAPDDMTIMGPFAGVILDAMPLPAALLTASKAITSSHVQTWVRSLDYLDVTTRLGSLANSLLTDAWPIGVGCDFEGQVAGRLVGGADLLGKTTAMRATASQLHLSVERKGELSCGGAAGLQLSNAFGDEVGALAKAEVSIIIDDNSDLYIDVDLVPLIQTMGRIHPDFLLNVLTGDASGRGLLDIGANIGQFLDVLATETVSMDWSSSPMLSIGAGAQAFAGNDLSIANLLDGAAEQLPGLVQVIASLAQKMSGATGVLLELEPIGSCQFNAKYTCEAGAAGQLLSMEPQLAQALDDPSRDWLTHGLGAKLSMMLQVPMTLHPGTGIVVPDTAGAMITVQTHSEMGATEIADHQTVALTDLPSLLSAITTGGDLDALLQDNAFPTFERTLRMEVTAERMDTAFPEWQDLLDAIPDCVLPSETVLYVEGKALLPPDALNTLIGHGIQLPDCTDGMTAVWDLGNLVIDLATGNTTVAPPDWLAGHETALFEAAAQVHLCDTRLRGHFHLGQGGGIDAGAGIEASGSARMEAGIVLDQVLEDADATRVVRALGRSQSAA